MNYLILLSILDMFTTLLFNVAFQVLKLGFQGLELIRDFIAVLR